MQPPAAPSIPLYVDLTTDNEDIQKLGVAAEQARCRAEQQADSTQLRISRLLATSQYAALPSQLLPSPALCPHA